MNSSAEAASKWNQRGNDPAAAADQTGLMLQLRESQQWLNLAADSAGVGLWGWDFRTSQLWATEQARLLYGFAADEPIAFEKFFSKVLPDDLGSVVEASQTSLQE